VIDIPLAISGPATIALIVVPGIFAYPWLLRRPGGRAAIAVTTLVLAAFSCCSRLVEASTVLSFGCAGLLALAPLAAGIVVARLQGPSSP
jgi:hypothetical protein